MSGEALTEKIFSIDSPNLRVNTVDKYEKDRVVQEISEILSQAIDASEASIHRAAAEMGLRVITQKQFKVMQWGTKQLKIRRLQDECERILRDIGVGRMR